MKELNPEEQTLVVSLYRQLKTNPKEFKLTNSSRDILFEIIDLKEFDIDLKPAPVLTYYAYSTGCYLVEALPDKERGEDYRLVSNVISKTLFAQGIKTLSSIRKNKDLNDDVLVIAAYIHLGIVFKLIPMLNRNQFISGCKLTLEDSERVNAQAS